MLVYLSPREIGQVADALLSNWESCADDGTQCEKMCVDIAKRLIEKNKGIASAPDIALFGRMLADKPDAKIDAACQVAHAISTHRVTMEMDYFSAVDEEQGDDETGAGHINVTGFNSACFYRYSRLDWDQLLSNLGDQVALARRTVEAFLRASEAAIPTGKQNAFANHNRPSFMLAVVSDGGVACNLANAFERPVRPLGDSGYVIPSVQKLEAYWNRFCAVYGSEKQLAVAALALDQEIKLSHPEHIMKDSIEEWVQAVMAVVPREEGQA